MKKIITLVLLTAIVEAAISQESVHIKNGSIVRGTVTENNGNVNVLTSDGSVFVYDTADVLKITSECKAKGQTVFLKDGSIIKGCVFERKPGKSVSVRTKDGIVSTYPMEKVQHISNGDNSRIKRDTKTSYKSDLYRGYRGFVDYSFLVGGESLTYGGHFTTVHGGYVLPYLFVGGGIGIGMDLYKATNDSFQHSFEFSIPFFFNLRGYYPLRNGFGGPFVEFRIGFDPLNFGPMGFSSSPFMTSAVVGWRWETGDGGMNLSVGWRGKTPYWRRGNQFMMTLGYDF